MALGIHPDQFDEATAAPHGPHAAAPAPADPCRFVPLASMPDPMPPPAGFFSPLALFSFSLGDRSRRAFVPVARLVSISEANIDPSIPDGDWCQSIVLVAGTDAMQRYRSADPIARVAANYRAALVDPLSVWN